MHIRIASVAAMASLALIAPRSAGAQSPVAARTLAFDTALIVSLTSDLLRLCGAQ